MDSLEVVLQRLSFGETIIIGKDEALFIIDRIRELEQSVKPKESSLRPDRRKEDRRRINWERVFNMAKVHFVQSARKDNPIVKKGESYYWWQHGFGTKEYSKTEPTKSQVQSSSFLKQLYALEESLPLRFIYFDSMKSDMEDILTELENLKDECQDSLDNMPEHLQDSSPTGEILNERIECLESALSEMNDIEIPELSSEQDDLSEERLNEWKEDQLSEIREAVNSAWPEL